MRPILRRLSALALILTLTPLSCLREPPRPESVKQQLGLRRLAVPPARRLGALGPFRLEGAWHLTSPFSGFGSYSAMVPLPRGQLLALSDRGGVMTFSPPGAAQEGVLLTTIRYTRRRSRDLDAESATRDPATGRIWVGTESSNGISRHDPNLRVEARAWPPAMKAWDRNEGPEAMTRLSDGRFVVLAEGFDGVLENRLHQAVLFPGDPTRNGGKGARFRFSGPEGFKPTDMATLPDGRALVLFRRLVPRLPMFEGRIAVADPAELRPGKVWTAREIARLEPPLPTDNYEAMTVVSRGDGMVTVWLMSDDNVSVLQRTLLLKLALDPAKLKPARAKVPPAR